MENLHGDLEGETSGGHIDLDRIQGNVDVKTSDGTIKGDRIHGKIYARTSGGSVNIEKIWDQSLKIVDLPASSILNLHYKSVLMMVM